MTRPAYKFHPCKDHPGRNVANHPCEHRNNDGSLCGWSPNSEAVPKTTQPEARLSLVASGEKEARVLQAVDTKPNVESEIVVQPTLSDELFPAVRREEVPTVKISFTGSVEMPAYMFDRLCEGDDLAPGRVVHMQVAGYLPGPHAVWTKRTEEIAKGKRKTYYEPEGRVAVKVLEIGSFELGGEYHGE